MKLSEEYQNEELTVTIPRKFLPAIVGGVSAYLSDAVRAHKATIRKEKPEDILRKSEWKVNNATEAKDYVMSQIGEEADSYRAARIAAAIERRRDEAKSAALDSSD